MSAHDIISTHFITSDKNYILKNKKYMQSFVGAKP